MTENELEIRVKNIDLNIEKDIRFLLANEHKYLQKCTVEETDDECIFHFDMEAVTGFKDCTDLKQEDRYRLLYNVGEMEDLTGEYSIDLSPQNLVYDINLIPRLLIRDRKGDMNNPDFFEQYRALAAALIIRKYTFEQYYTGGGRISEKNFISKCKNTKDLQEELLKRYIKECETNKKEKLLVRKGNYKRMKYTLPAALLLTVGTTAFALYMQFVRIPYQNKIVSAYGSYMKSDYINVENALKTVNAKDLSTDVKYILARSYIFTEGLTYEQRENLLEYTGVNIDTNIFDFWIYLGRGDFAMAEDIAKKIGNNEFLLFTYIKHNAYLKYDVTISGEDKAALIKDLDQKISELSKSMEEGINEESGSPEETAGESLEEVTEASESQ